VWLGKLGKEEGVGRIGGCATGARKARRAQSISRRRGRRSSAGLCASIMCRSRTRSQLLTKLEEKKNKINNLRIGVLGLFVCIGVSYWEGGNCWGVCVCV
jgi:hypothetical protein